MQKVRNLLKNNVLKYHLLTLFALFFSFFLATISLLGLCASACSETKHYTLFGGSFEVFGLLFFGILIFLQLLSTHYIKLKGLIALLISSALGAEIYFIWIQKAIIGSFCPICLSIATCILIANYGALKSYNEEIKNMELKGVK
jgi:uncharacterized membrane protein